MQNPFSPTSTGFSWEPIQLNNLPTPLDHDTVDFNPSHNLPRTPNDDPELQHMHSQHQFGGSGAFDAAQRTNEQLEDVVMNDHEPVPVNDATIQQNGRNRRRRYAELDWEGHRETIRKLYMEQRKTLDETMEIMRNIHGFEAPVKIYKEKIKFWGWQKYLSKGTAQWMVEKANSRRAMGKETKFKLGDQEWTPQQAFNRTGRRKEGPYESVSTPAGMIVETPGGPNDHFLDSEDEIQPTVEDRALPSNVPVRTEISIQERTLPLSYNGKTRMELNTTLIAAREYSKMGEFGMAEEAYVEAFQGFDHLLSSTHNEVVKIGYELATFYTQQERKAESDKLLENMTSKHVSSLGLAHRKTVQHLMHVAELLNSWNRELDALALLEHAWEHAETQDNDDDYQPVRIRTVFSARDRLHAANDEISVNSSSARINRGLDTARLHATTNEPAVEILLKGIEAQCLKDPIRLAVQGLRARAALLKHYLKQDRVIHNHDAFDTALDRLGVFWAVVSWRSKSFNTQEIIEASLELASGLLRGGFDQKAYSLFREIDRKTSSSFGSDDERTVWAIINIGLLYQTYGTWAKARPWFEQAYAAADSVWGEKDGVTMSLENALEKRHFSYISDEGRPFKTAFGVCGLTIRPTRLHLE